MINNISDKALYFYLQDLGHLTISHNITIYCLEYKNYDDAKAFEDYARGRKEKEIIIKGNVRISLVHTTVIDSYKDSVFSTTKYRCKLSTKTFGRLVEEDIQYGCRRFRGWGDKYGSEDEINDIKGLFTTNVKILYR